MKPARATPTDSVMAYAGHWEHVRDELNVLDAQLRELVQRIGQRRMGPADAAPTSWGHGIFVGDDEVEALLGRRPERGDGAQRSEIAERVAVSESQGVHLPLEWLRRTFNLSAWEYDVLLLCLAPELESRYERIYAHLHDDITKRRPSVDLALDLLGEDLKARAAGRAALSADASLRRGGLVVIEEDERSGARAAQVLRLEPRIAGLLTGEGVGPVRPWVTVQAPKMRDPQPLADRVVRLVKGSDSGNGRISKLIVALHGGEPGDEISFAEEVCAGLEVPLLIVDVGLLITSGAPFESTIRAELREGLLRPAGVLVHRIGRSGDNQLEADLRLRQISAALDDLAWLAFIADRDAPRPAAGQRHTWLNLELPGTDLARRAARWRETLADIEVVASDEELDSLATRYRVAPSDIVDIAAAARMRAQLDHPGTIATLHDIEAACREAAAPVFRGLARRVRPRFEWEDIVLPSTTRRQLSEIDDAVRCRRRLTDWGFGDKILRGKGVSAMFSGPPGTGKTMAAEVIAGSLGLDLYAVDLASVVSKYIGETEKNLSRIFDAAEAANGLLFFDEADALFGKRSEVKDAHDRYANIEVSYLLQRIENYVGLSVLATNFKQNVDEAFVRRIDFLVDFPFPGPAERLAIWRRTIPARAPLEDGIDWDFLARQFALAGAEIRGAVLYSAYQAAAGSRRIGMRDLLLGVRRELDKVGKGSGPTDFGRYWELVTKSEA